MVANLLEFNQQTENHAAPLDASCFIDFRHRLVNGLLIQSCLFGGETAEDIHLLLLRQILNNVAIGFQAT